MIGITSLNMERKLEVENIYSYLITIVAVSGEIPMAKRYASKFSFPRSFQDPSRGIKGLFLQFPKGGS